MNFYEYLVAFYNITIFTQTRPGMKTFTLNWLHDVDERFDV